MCVRIESGGRLIARFENHKKESVTLSWVSPGYFLDCIAFEPRLDTSLLREDPRCGLANNIPLKSIEAVIGKGFTRVAAIFATLE